MAQNSFVEPTRPDPPEWYTPTQVFLFRATQKGCIDIFWILLSIGAIVVLGGILFYIGTII